MTTRTDVIIDYSISPRIITVEYPSAEIIIQDIVDTLRVDEESFHGGLTFSKLLDASGKEDLGGGTKVGITGALQDALLSFEARTTPRHVGTITEGSGSIINGLYSFIDENAEFIFDGVRRGSLVINFTDQSIADVYEIISETELKTKV